MCLSSLPPIPAAGDTIAVWFSCGAASAIAARLCVDTYAATNTIRILNNPIAEEDSDNRRFLTDVESWLGVPIESVTNPAYPNSSCVEIWNKRQYMSGVAGAPCTMLLKKNARQHWEANNHADWHVLGFTAEERKRSDNFMLTERPNLLPLLINAGITKAKCYALLRESGISPPRMYSLGYPNANCIGCVKATSPTYWNHVRRVHPDIFAQRAAQSRALGARLVRVEGKRIFLDELSPSAKGRAMNTLDFECGIFCEERSL